MKCEKCGKEANVFYRSNINGKVSTMNLCSECAEKLNGENGFTNMEKAFDNMFGNFFGGLFTPMTLNPWNSFGFGMPMMNLPRFRIMLEPMTDSEPKDTAAAPAEPRTENETKDEQKIDPEMSKRRELNMLRQQMAEAVKNEEFEKAAELRDKIHGLE